MNIRELRPIDIVLDGDYTEMYERLTYRLLQLGRYTNSILNELIANTMEETDWEMVHIKFLYNQWEKCMIENATVLNEPQRFGEVKTTLNAHIFVELSRLHMIIWFDRLTEEQEQVLSLETMPSRERQKDYFTLWSLNVTNSEFWTNIPLPDALDWNQPVMKYSQEEIIAAVNMLCEVMHDLGDPHGKYADTTQEFIDFFRVLYTRNAMLMCQGSCVPEVLNEVEMREFVDEEELMCIPNIDYFVWCSFYFGAIMRRIYYWSKIKQNEIPERPEVDYEEIKNCQEWLVNLVELLGEDGYEDCYMETCAEAYTIPGDLEWFSFKYPTKQPVLGSILFELRPQLRKRFQEDQHLSQDTVLEKTKQDIPKFMCRVNSIFVLNCVDTHLRNMGTQWKNAIMVQQEGIELSAWKLSRPLWPVLLQIFSRYVVYNKLHYITCDSIYEAIIIWFKLLRDEYNSKLFGKDLSEIADKLLL